MMSLTKINMAKTVKKQYLFKLKANIDSLSSLVWIQLLAVLFSLGGVGTSGMGNGELNIEVKYYSSDLVIIFTLIWSLVTAITITTKSFRNQDFTLVTNRVTSCLSNILFLVTTSILGAVTAVLSGNLLKLVRYLFFDHSFYSLDSNWKMYVLGFSMTFFYLIFVSSIGYLIGTLTQISKIFVFAIPVSIIGVIAIEGFNYKEPFIVNLFQFYVFEPSIIVFILKVCMTTAILFFISTFIFNRLEVRK